MAAAARRTWPVAPVSCCGGSGTIWTATPIVYNSGDYQISGSGFDLHLFTGQQWYSELGLYDLRNRFYSPDIGRFLQPDPIGFNGDATNLYRYCGNNPLTGSDPMGTDVVFIAAGPHSFVGVTNPSAHPNGMTYFDFYPKPGLVGLLTLDLLYPGVWSSHNWRSQGYQWATIANTPEEDTSVLGAFNDRVQNQGDWYSALFNNCYSAAADVVDEALNSNTDSGGPSDGGSNLDFITLSDAGSVPPVVVSAPPLSPNEQAKLNGLTRLQMRYNPYWGYIPTTMTTNWAGGIAGLQYGGGSPHDLRNQVGGLNPIDGFLNISIGVGFPAMEPAEPVRGR